MAPTSEWQIFLSNYRVSHPDLNFKDAQKRASAKYKNPRTCNKINLKKKIARMDPSEIQETCRKLDTTASPVSTERYVLVSRRRTRQPTLSRQDKPEMPSKKAPTRPVVFLEKALERELDKLLDKVILRVAYYYASSNVWNYKKKMILFMNKLVSKLKDKHGTLKSEEFNKIVQQKLGAVKSYNKTAALNPKFKTSKIAFDKISEFLKTQYDIEL